MSEVNPVHRYKAQTLFSFGGAKIEYFPHGPEVVLATELDAQRLRADTAEAERDDLLEENRIMTLTNAGLGRILLENREFQSNLYAAEQRIAELEARYGFLCKVTPYRFRKMQDAASTDGGDVIYFHAHRFDAQIDAALNQKSEGESQSDYLESCKAAERALRFENQRITPARFKCLACGDYHEGSGNLPCPRMNFSARTDHDQ